MSNPAPAGLDPFAEEQSADIPVLPPTYAQLGPQVWLPGEQVSFTIPAGTFTDPQGETLTYAAYAGSDLGSLPSWLTFNAATQTFSGIVPADQPARLSISVIATDSSGLWTGGSFLVSTTTNSLINADLSPSVSAQSLSHLPNTPITLTYSFMTAVPANPFYSQEADNFQPVTAAEQTAIQKILAAYSAVANITFVPVADSSSANVRFGTDIDPDLAYSGYTVFDPTGQTDQAQVLFNNSPQQAYPFAYLVLHEVANVLHLADYAYGGSATALNASGLPSADRNSDYLVGEDVPNSAGAYSPQMGNYPLTTPMLLDVQALQYLYGANQNGLTPGWVATSYGRSYQFSDNATPQCIWVGSAVGGITSFDFSACSGSAIINLNPGSFSSTVASAPASWITDNVYLDNQAGNPTQNIAIAYGTTIQEAIGNNAGDVFYANAAVDTLIGGSGNDIFHVSSGAVAIYGGGDTDTVVFTDPKADYSIVANGHGGLLVTETGGAASNGAATLYDIARLQFADQTVTTAIPQVTDQTATQTWISHQNVSFTLPASTFTDPQGQTLTLTATQANGSALPSWLSFNGATFSGTVPAGTTGLSLQVTATDTGGLAMLEQFSVTINSSLVTTVPSAVSVSEGQANSLAGMQVSDSNSQSAGETVTVTLTDQTGTLAAQAAAGGHVNGSGTQNLTLSGSLAQVNAELAGVTYTGAVTSSATTDTITVTSSNGLGDANTQQIAITDSAGNYLTGTIVPQSASGTILSGPGTWTIVDNCTLAGAGTTASLVPANGATLVNQGDLTLGNGSLSGFIGNLNGGQIVHGSLVNAAGATLTVNSGGIAVDSFTNAGTLNLVLNQLATFTDYSGQQSETLTIDSSFTNTGTIAISSDNNIGGVVMFEGGGTMSANAFILGSAAVNSAYLVGVEFGGTVPYTITGGVYDLYSPVSVNAGATLNITGSTTFTHNFTDYGTINVLSGTLTDDYDLWGSSTSGVVNIDPGASVDIVSSVLAPGRAVIDATINFNGANAKLILGTPSTFNAVLTGFAAGDVIDLANTQATAAAITGGNLVVSDGGNTIATIPFSGLAAGSPLTTESDGAGGTLILYGESASAALATSSGSAPVIDSAADVASHLDGLQTLAAAGRIPSITLTDGGTPTLSITATQQTIDAGALKAIVGAYTLSVSTGAAVTLVNPTSYQETLSPPAGNATIEGGGYDVIDLSFSASSTYSLTANASGTVTLAATGSSDLVGGVAQIEFADKTVTLAASGSNAEYVALLYQGALGRTPDPGGFAYWVSQANALPASAQALGPYALSDASSIVAGFTGSPEFVAKYGTLNNTQYVTQLYANVLDRAPDPGGFAYWTGQLAAGESRNDVLIGIAESPEAINNATQGFTGQSGTHHAAWLFLT